MATKSTSTTARSSSKEGADEAPSPKAKKKKASISKQKEDALSLIDDKPKRKRATKKTATQKSAEEKAETGKPQKKSLGETKKEALSLFEESERKTKAKGRKKILDEKEIEKKKGGEALPPISRLKAEEEEARKKRLGILPSQEQPAAVVAQPATETETGAEAAGGGNGDGDGGATGEDDPRVINIKPPIIVKELADMMKLKPFMIIKDLIELDIFANPNQSLEPDIAAQICEKHGFIFEKEKREKGGGVHKVEEVIEEPTPPEEEVEEELQFRAPIVTLMGHVDHGKTSILDAIRKGKVAAGEVGGITQHVAAYSVEHNSKSITFLDTPGHAAFTAMRARGANVTDIVILVIAADDGIMPQTVEAMNHAKAAGVKIMVALNKIDLPGANPDRVKAQLQENDLAPEDWGGQTSVVEVSALEGKGIDDLLEMISLEAEVLELRANPTGITRAPIIEAKIEAGKGPTATLIVQSGTLRVGMPFISGACFGKVKSLLDSQGKPIKEAGPSTPVEVLGFNDLPHVGDEMVEMESERAAKKLSEERVGELRQQKLQRPARANLQDLFNSTAAMPRLRLVLKTDVQGTAEAILGELNDIKSEKITVDVLHSGAGAITESDILLASASDAIVIGFNTKVEGKAVKIAKAEGVEVKLYSIIYELIDQVKEAMLGKLDPEMRETVTGHAEVKQVFKLSKGRVAGCLVTDGRIPRSARARVLRGGQPVYDGGLATLRRFQDEVNEVRNGLECGIKLGKFNDYEAGDIIECYELEKLDQTL